MGCPKGLRDGPCGGTDIHGMCETDPSLPCVWLRIYERIGRVDRLMKLQDDLDWRGEGTSSWLPLLKQVLRRGRRLNEDELTDS